MKPHSTLICGALLLGACLPALAPPAAAQPAPTFGSRDEVLRRCLRVTRFYAEKYQQKDAPLVLEPVALPYGEDLLGNNTHFGWPVATKTDDTLIVVFHRKPQHTPRFGVRKAADEHTSAAVMTRSTDGGQTWSKPIDMRQFIETPTNDCRLGFGNALATLADGTVVLVSEYGVFRSRNQGRTWTHLPGAYGPEQLPGPVTNNGPRLLQHPEYGLVALSHERADLLIRYSTDEGETWQEEKQLLPDWAQPIEPTGLMHDGALFIVARCHGAKSFEPHRRTWRYMQLVSESGWIPTTPALTNIRVTDIRDEMAVSGYGPWSQDTVALIFNPLTERIEAVCTNRNGGGQGREQMRLRMTLNLWSIDPAALRSGESQWRFEGTLLARGGTMMTGTDGMHPGGSVVDAEAGVQHIFIYAGLHLGPSGIFRITRSLDTPKLRAYLETNSDYPAEPPMKPTH